MQRLIIPVWKPCSYSDNDGMMGTRRRQMCGGKMPRFSFLLLPHDQKKHGNPFASMFVKHGFILDGCLGWGGVYSELCAISILFKGEIGQQRLDETSYRTSRNSCWAWNSFDPRNSLKQTSIKSNTQ